MALSTARMHKVRGRPPLLAGDQLFDPLPFLVGQVAWVGFFVHLPILHNPGRLFRQALRETETSALSVRLGNYSASHFEGSAYCIVSSSLIKIVGPSFAVGFLAREHMKDTAHDRVCHGDHRPILPTTCRQALIQRREIRPLGSYGGMGELGQDSSEGTIPLAGFARALLARTFIVARGHAGPCRQTRCSFKP